MTRGDVDRLFRWFAVCVVLAVIMWTAGLIGAGVLVWAVFQ